MIRDRPPSLAENPFYARAPRVDITADLGGLPDLLRLDLVSLSGVQPITKAIAEAAGGNLRDNLSPGEVALHRQRDARFQLIFIVLNLFDLKEVDGKVTGRPYAISLVPATKRGAVTEVGVDWIEKMNLEPSPFHGQAYLDFDPFTGDRGLFGSAVMFRDGGALDRLHPDEIGFVTDGFLLAPIMDGDEPLLPDAKLTGERANARYAKHRAKTYFKPFQDDRPRRVWGLESPIELFLAQGLADRGLYPDFQALFLRDGATFPSYYHMLDDPALRTRLDAITSADLYFPEHKLAVFCDSTLHHRSLRAREKDANITKRLSELGIEVLRLPGRTIVGELPAAVDAVIERLGRIP